MCITLIAIIAAGMIDLSLSTYRLSKRNEFRARAQAVAESEIEYLYFQFRSECLLGTLAGDVPASTRITGIANNSSEPTTIRTPFLPNHRTEGWRVRRALQTDRTTIQGNVPGTSKMGQYTYVNARVEVLGPVNSPIGETINVRIGRRFINSNSSVFQYSIFYQGDLEMTPGTDTTITGDVAVNGNVYLASSNGSTLTINNNIKYLHGSYFNKDSSGLTALNNPNAPFRSDALTAPVFATSKESQVFTYDEAENFLGGLELVNAISSRPDLFGADRDQALNRAYRSVIVPPPTASTIDEYPSPTTGRLADVADDPTINASRAYKRAGIIVTVEPDGALQIVDDDGVNITALLSSAIDTTKSLTDQRENKVIALREIDLAALDSLISANVPDFRGLLYVNLKGANGGSPAAVRLVNAKKVPNIGGSGFSFATNAGLYIKGDYNTEIAPSTAGKVPSMLMSDAVTVLSEDWNDANSALPIANRKVTSGTALTVNAGLLTGTMTSTNSNYSGGANNIVRYLEDWRGGSTVTLHGAIGRLFRSTIMTGGFQQPGNVYFPPARNFSFDSQLAATPPPGGINTTSYSRGNFFNW
jgi:hypothetical protein